MSKYQPTIPMELDNNQDIKLIDSAFANAKQNLKMILFTNPGEKIMDPNFGVGIKKYLFETASGFVNIKFDDEDNKYFFLDNYRTKLKNSLIAQCKKYLQEISIDEVIIKIEDNILYFSLYFTFKDFYQDTISLTEMAT